MCLPKEKAMYFDLLTARRVLRACQAGLPIPEALMLIDTILDGLSDEQTWESLDYLLKAALMNDQAWLSDMCKELRGPVPLKREEEHHG
jgi:hypothetical protein